MAARAIWKGVLCIHDLQVPVKLYSALVDRSVHFRLLHRKDQAPVQQVMVNSKTGKPVPPDEIQKAFPTTNNRSVILTPSELDELQPPKSREIEVSEFLPRQNIDHHWYERPYYLTPDGSEQNYLALSQALERSQKVGLARWVMRNKEYTGALTLHQGYPMLITMRHAHQVVPLAGLEAPGGEDLSPRDLLMARQLINMLESDFDPMQFQDEYRARVLELVAEKQQGKNVKKLKPKQPQPSSDINKALQASLQRARA